MSITQTTYFQTDKKRYVQLAKSLQYIATRHEQAKQTINRIAKFRGKEYAVALAKAVNKSAKFKFFNWEEL